MHKVSAYWCSMFPVYLEVWPSQMNLVKTMSIGWAYGTTSKSKTLPPQQMEMLISVQFVIPGKSRKVNRGHAPLVPTSFCSLEYYKLIFKQIHLSSLNSQALKLSTLDSSPCCKWICLIFNINSLSLPSHTEFEPRQRSSSTSWVLRALAVPDVVVNNCFMNYHC